MSFKDVIGQDKAISILSNSFRFGKIANAYIFAGKDSIGKKKTALEFAKLLNCTNIIGNESCEICSNCRKINSFIHQDICLYNLDNKNILIDDIREIQKSLLYKNSESNYRFAIIDHADNFTIEASNCFLKTLEEPPSNTIIILIVNSLTSLISTILSRCQVIKFVDLLEEDKISILKNIISKNHSEIKEALYFCNGSMEKVLNFLDNDDGIIQDFIEIEKGILSKDITASFHKKLESIAKDKEIFGKFIDFLVNKIDFIAMGNNLEFLEMLLKAKKFLNRNVNPKLVSNWIYLQNLAR